MLDANPMLDTHYLTGLERDMDQFEIGKLIETASIRISYKLK